MSESVLQAPVPLLMTVRDAMKLSGVSSSEFYVKLNRGAITARKMRRSTLIETASLVAAINALPKY